MLTATAPTNGDDVAYGMAFQADGRIVTAGYCDMAGATGTDACLASYDNAGTVSQYTSGISDWATSGPSHLAACLRGVTSAAATWTTNATCPTTDGAHWNAIPPSRSRRLRTTRPARVRSECGATPLAIHTARLSQVETDSITRERLVGTRRCRGPS